LRSEGFRQSWEWLHRMTVDFVKVVPHEKWDFSPDPPGKVGRAQIPRRKGDGFAPFCKQLRHVVCVRGVYNAAMVTKKADFSLSHSYYNGPLTREALLSALSDKQQQFLATLETLDIEKTIDFGGTAFTFDNFVCEMIQHEAIHHGQWSVYASLGGFETPLSWRASWGL
jgi:hypothetical protein